MFTTLRSISHGAALLLLLAVATSCGPSGSNNDPPSEGLESRPDPAVNDTMRAAEPSGPVLPAATSHAAPEDDQSSLPAPSQPLHSVVEKPDPADALVEELRKLIESDPRRAADTALTVMRGGSFEEKESALNELANAAPNQFVAPVVVSAVLSEETILRNAAVKLLDAQDPQMRLSILQTILSAKQLPPEETRMDLYNAAAELKGQAVAAIMLNGMRDPDPSIRATTRFHFEEMTAYDAEDFDQANEWWAKNKHTVR